MYKTGITPELDSVDRDLYGVAWRKGAQGYLRTYETPPKFLHKMVAQRILHPELPIDALPPLPKDIRVGHVDENHLNNRRNNIRIRTYSEQLRGIRKKHSTPFRGVYKMPDGRLRVKVYYDEDGKRKEKHVGFFDADDLIEAAHAYDEAAKELVAHPILNFPDTEK